MFQQTQNENQLDRTNSFNEEFDRYAGGSGHIPGLGFGIDFAGYNREQSLLHKNEDYRQFSIDQKSNQNSQY